MAGTSEQPIEYGQQPLAVPDGATELLLVRHGQSAAFQPGRPFDLVDGQGNPPLTDHGRWQAAEVGRRLASVGVDAIYVTTLQRTAQTAAPLAALVGLVPIVEPDLREIHLGEWEGGLFRQKAATLDPVFVEMQRTGDWGMIPGAESSSQLQERVVRAIERIHAAHPGQRVVAVSHGGAIGAALSHATGARAMALSSADNGSINHLVLAGDRWTLRRYNDTGHLSGELSSRAEGLT